MYKIFKYLFIANVYKRAKKSIIFLTLSLVALVLTTFMMNDVIAVSSGIGIYILLLGKWSMILLLMGFIGFNIVKIINIFVSPFKASSSEGSNKALTNLTRDTKKSKILNKETLFTKSDLIIQKYVKDA